MSTVRLGNLPESGVETSAVKPAVQPVNGLSFTVARTALEVRQAWNLVHDSYVRAGLIDAKPDGIHTVPQAMGPQSAVLLGRLGHVIVATMTCILDHPGGLPLDKVYKPELDGLRGSGRRLMELGLFADRREHISRSFAAVLELMHYAFYFGLHNDRTDGIIGVHPRHAAFYEKYFAFRTAGEEKTYATVKDRPVVLLRLDWQTLMQQQPKPQGLAYFLESPISAKELDSRFAWREGEWDGLAMAG